MSTKLTIRQCFDILEIPNSATLDEAKEAYRLLSSIWHPDKHEGRGEKIRTKATTKMQELTTAWEQIQKHFKKQPQGQRYYQETKTEEVREDFDNYEEAKYYFNSLSYGVIAKEILDIGSVMNNSKFPAYDVAQKVFMTNRCSPRQKEALANCLAYYQTVLSR